MGPLKSPLSPCAPPPPPPRPTSPPSKRSPPHRHPRLPLPLPLPLPPPPPLPYHLSCHSSCPPLPPPPCRAPHRVSPRHGTPPGPGAAAGTVLPAPSPITGRPARGDHSLEDLVPALGFPVTQPIRGDDDLAGVPPEMLPPKKRFVRYHPYEAAYAIQEMASHGRGVCLNRPALLTAEGGEGVRGDKERQDRDDELRAELLRFRLYRPALVLTKRLTPSDRSRNKACLVLPDSLVRTSPLLNMLTEAERHLVFSGEGGGLPVPAFDRRGRTYRMALKRDHRLTGGTYRLTGQWSLFALRHSMRDGDTVEMLAFRPPGWQAPLDRSGEGGLGVALLHCRDARDWSNRERDATRGLLHLAADPVPPGTRSRARRRRRRNHNATTGP